MGRRSWKSEIDLLRLHLRNVEMRLPLPNPIAEQRVLRLLHLLQPFQCQGIELARVGSPFDGGYIVPRNLDFDIAVSFGIGDNCDVECELAEAGTEVLAFDHTIEGLPRAHPGVRWASLALGSASGPGVVSLQDQLREVTKMKSIFFIDVEGDEWSSIASCESDLLAEMDCLVIEWHGLDRLMFDDEWLLMEGVLARLNESHLLVHVHANNDCPTYRCLGRDIPSTLECTYVSRRHAPSFERAIGPWPTPLDRPNNPNFTDIDLTSLWPDSKSG